MSIKVRFDLNVAEPAEVATAVNFSINFIDGLLADKTGIEAGSGEIDGQIPGSHDPGLPLSSSSILPDDPGTGLAVTGGDESTNVSKGVSVYLFASSDGSVDPGRPGGRSP